MDLKSCDACGLVYDADKVTLPTEEEIEKAQEEGRGDEVCEWNGDDFYPVFQCRCGENISIKER